MSMRSSSGCFISLLGNSSGCFTVKSAYLAAMSMGSREETANLSNDVGMSYFWHSLWHLNLPRKNFVRRVCQIILHTRLNLHRRGVVSLPTVLFVRASLNLQNKFCGPVVMQKKYGRIVI